MLENHSARLAAKLSYFPKTHPTPDAMMLTYINGHAPRQARFLSQEQSLGLVSKNHCLHVSSVWDLIIPLSKVPPTFCSYRGNCRRSSVQRVVQGLEKGCHGFYTEGQGSKQNRLCLPW